MYEISEIDIFSLGKVAGAPVINGIIGFIMGLVAGLVYNLLARTVGGLRFTLREDA